MRTKIIVIATVLVTSLKALAVPPAEEGKTLFTTRCAACHNVNKVLVGPALAGVDQRRSIDWIINFVHSSQKVVKSGDAYAVALFDKFKVVMPDHPDLTPDNIKNIVDYIKAESKTAVTQKQPAAEPEKAGWYTKIEMTPGLIVTFIALLSLLVMSMILLAKVKALQRANEKNI